MGLDVMIDSRAWVFGHNLDTAAQPANHYCTDSDSKGRHQCKLEAPEPGSGEGSSIFAHSP